MSTPMESTTSVNNPTLATLGCSMGTSGALRHR